MCLSLGLFSVCHNEVDTITHQRLVAEGNNQILLPVQFFHFPICLRSTSTDFQIRQLLVAGARPLRGTIDFWKSKHPSVLTNAPDIGHSFAPARK